MGACLKRIEELRPKMVLVEASEIDFENAVAFINIKFKDNILKKLMERILKEALRCDFVRLESLTKNLSDEMKDELRVVLLELKLMLWNPNKNIEFKL